MTTANKKLFKPHSMWRRHTGYDKEADVSHNIGLFLGACVIPVCPWIRLQQDLVYILQLRHSSRKINSHTKVEILTFFAVKKKADDCFEQCSAFAGYKRTDRQSLYIWKWWKMWSYCLWALLLFLLLLHFLSMATYRVFGGFVLRENVSPNVTKS